VDLSTRRPQPTPVPAYEPKRLDKRALEVEVTAGMRTMPTPMREEVLERKTELVRRFDLLAPRRVARMRHYVVGAVIGLPLLNWLVLSHGLNRWWLQVLIAAVYGVVAGLSRLSRWSAHVLFLVAALLTSAAAAPGLFSLGYGGRLAWIVYFCIGACIGISEDMSRDEGA